MPIEHDDLDGDCRRIRLSGRLDIPGTESIALQFATLASTQRRQVVLDLTGVSFLASIGIRAIISNAKALKERGGKLVLFVGDNLQIAKTLETTGIDTVIPMFTDAAQAQKAAQA